MKLFSIAVRVAGITAAALVVFVALGVGWLKWRKRPIRDCPISVQLTPIPHDPISDKDHIQLRSFPGLSSFTPAQVTIYGDGRVERETTVAFHPFPNSTPMILGCPLHPEDRLVRIPEATAKAIIREARDRGFCRLCEEYSREVLDAGSSRITLEAGGLSHSVRVSAGDPPALYFDLLRKIDALSQIDSFADTRRYSPKRQQECDDFRNRQAAAKKDASH